MRRYASFPADHFVITARLLSTGDNSTTTDCFVSITAGVNAGPHHHLLYINSASSSFSSSSPSSPFLSFFSSSRRRSPVNESASRSLSIHLHYNTVYCDSLVHLCTEILPQLATDGRKMESFAPTGALFANPHVPMEPASGGAPFGRKFRNELPMDSLQIHTFTSRRGMRCDDDVLLFLNHTQKTTMARSPTPPPPAPLLTETVLRI